MKEKSASGKSNDATNAVQGLREHALNFTANKTGSGQVEIGKREHIALHAAFFFFINRHHQKHGNECGGDYADGTDGCPDNFRGDLQDMQGKKEDAPGGESEGQQAIRESFVMPAFFPE